jgi:hypothetical protein
VATGLAAIDCFGTFFHDRNNPANVLLFFKNVKPISKIVDHPQEQGADRRKSTAYTIVCEHFEEAGNAAIEG